MNFALTIVFGWEVTRVAQSGIVLIIQFTLLGMTVVFAFGLWITCKRKFLLLKLYTIILAAFVGVQIFAVIMLAMGSAETEDIANTVFEQARPCPARARRPCAADPDTAPAAQLCTATQAATDDAASTLQTHKVAANVDEASWFCCCPKRCGAPATRLLPRACLTLSRARSAALCAAAIRVHGSRRCGTWASTPRGRRGTTPSRPAQTGCRLAPR